MNANQRKTVNFFIYQSHSWFKENAIDIKADNKTFSLKVIDSSVRPKEAAYILISDELSTSSLPFYFPRSHRVALLGESPVYTKKLDSDFLRRHYDLVLTHREDLVQSGLPFVRVDFSANFVTDDVSEMRDIKKIKSASFIGSVKHVLKEPGYEFRGEVASILQKRGDIDCYGKGIKPIEHKTEGLIDYCFSVALENLRENYYYTEKIIDCFLTETVPIYWGCPKIEDIFDKRGIITFESVAELLSILSGLTFEKYREMLPYVRKNKQRCMDLKLDSFEGYLLRCCMAVEEKLSYPLQNLKSWQVGKPMAGIRLLAERLLGVTTR